MADPVFTIFAEGIESCPKLPVEFVAGDETRADRLCKSLKIQFPWLEFSHQPWTAHKLEEHPAFVAMCG